jgi:osmoprotectant transport system permease protein
LEGIDSWLQYLSDNRSEVIHATIDHFLLVVQVMVAATIIAVAVGILVHGRGPAKGLALGIAGVFLTIPSLALFTFFIPITGLGFRPAFIALTMYALLPILRNTVTGLEEVNPAVLESAQGMGMGWFRRLRKIQMPLAWPVIITGIRVSTLLTMGIAAIAAFVRGPGLGGFIREGLTRYPLPTSVERVWTGTIFIIVLALLVDAAYLIIVKLTTSKGLQ